MYDVLQKFTHSLLAVNHSNKLKHTSLAFSNNIAKSWLTTKTFASSANRLNFWSFTDMYRSLI